VLPDCAHPTGLQEQREGMCRRRAQRCCSLERARRGPPARPERSRLAQVRCYVGDNEERWFMWYSGRSAGCPGLDATTPAAGSIGAPCGAPVGSGSRCAVSCVCNVLHCGRLPV